MVLLQSEVLDEVGLLSQTADFISKVVLGLPALFWLFMLAF